ncbi:MAG: hypothetical protein V5A55_11980 [Halovenus sp.]
MTDAQRTRRSVLKSGAALAGLGLVGSLGGCVGDDDGSAEGSGGFSLSVVPGDVDGLVHVDVTALLGDDAVRSAADSIIAEQEQVDVGSFDEALDEVESEVGVDPEGVNDLAVFGADTTESAAVVLWTEFDSDELVSTIEEETGEDVEEDTYEGQTIYRIDGDPAAELDDGVFVAGDGAMVERVIDTWDGRADPLDGPVRDAFESAEEGYARFGFTPTEEIENDSTPAVQAIEAVSGSLYPDGDDRVVEVSVGTETEEAAADLEELLEAFVADLEQAAEEGSPFVSEELVTEIQERVSYEADGSALSIVYRASADDFADFVGEALGGLLLGLLGIPTGSADTTA